MCTSLYVNYTQINLSNRNQLLTVDAHGKAGTTGMKSTHIVKSEVQVQIPALPSSGWATDNLIKPQISPP